MSAISADARPEEPEADLTDEDAEHESNVSANRSEQPMLPAPAIRSQAPSQAPVASSSANRSQNGSRKSGVPAFFQNSGLVMRDGDGVIPSNGVTLPTEKSFTIQVGPEQFRLSGASIQSDAPSYFTQFFEAEILRRKEVDPEDNTPMRTLYVDRDPETFRDIALHLQGYHVQPRNSTHYVRLFVDAQFYVLPRLIKHLFESDVFMQIGEEDFCIPRDLFDSPGNHPNYFTLGFSLLFSTPGNPFPGLDVAGLLRPPAIKSAAASGRSGRIFADILDLLRGYDVEIRDEGHRAAILRDCRYYHLRGVEQKVIPHTISWNTQRSVSEIIMRVEDLRQSGISLADETDSKGLEIVRYARPFTDETPHELIVEVGKDSATIRPGNNLVVEFHGETRRQIMSLFKVVSSKFGQKLGQQSLDGKVPEMLRINEDGAATARIESDALVTIDGEEGWLTRPWADENVVQSIEEESSRKRRRLDTGESEAPVEHTREWTVMRAQWRIRLESWARGGESEDRHFAIHLYGVNIDVVKGQKGRSRRRGFLTS